MSKETLVTDLFVEKKIKEYFRDNLSQYVKGDDAWKINWTANKTFERPADLYWLDFKFLANPPFQQELGTGGRNRWQGIMQINICVPRDDASGDVSNDFEDSAMDICYQNIAKVFRRGVIFNGIRIIKCCRNTSAMQFYDDFCLLPVSIYWQSDLSN